ncbi:iron transporter [Vibrio cholerae]|nr:iron transporter [Vibrio cholerae]
MVTVGVFEFCGMRCQPLRRALGIPNKQDSNKNIKR